MATWRTSRDVSPCPLPHPLGHRLCLLYGWRGLAEKLATLGQRPRLTPVGQQTDMAHALQSLGQDMQEKASDELVG